MPGDLTGDEIGAPEIFPAWVRKAIFDHPMCDICGDPVLTSGRTRHIVCDLFEREP